MSRPDPNDFKAWVGPRKDGDLLLRMAQNPNLKRIALRVFRTGVANQLELDAAVTLVLVCALNWMAEYPRLAAMALGDQDLQAENARLREQLATAKAALA